MAKQSKTQSEKKSKYPVELHKGNAYDLVHMLSYRRPSRKQTTDHYAAFLATYIEPVMGQHDGHYNYIHIVTEGGVPLTETTIPRIAYMAHHDTVHTECSSQFDNLRYNTDKEGRVVMFVMNNYEEVEEEYVGKKWCQIEKKMVDLTPEIRKVKKLVGKSTNCLGADCTSGVWLILEMIKAQVPGVYVIHNDEEIGRIGAEYIVKTFTDTKKQVDDLSKFPIAKFRPQGLENGWGGLSFEERMEILPHYFWIDHVDIAMSFDRKDCSSVITRQRGSRTASDEFANDISKILSPDLVALGYKPYVADPTGSFTDSASYDKVIKECTNLSIGYYSQHTDRESQDMTFIVALRDTLIKNGSLLNNREELGSYRDPNAIETYPVGSYVGYGANAYRGYAGNGGYFDDREDSYYSSNNGRSTDVTVIGKKRILFTHAERTDVMRKTGLIQYKNESFVDFDHRLSSELTKIKKKNEVIEKKQKKKVESQKQKYKYGALKGVEEEIDETIAAWESKLKKLEKEAVEDNHALTGSQSWVDYLEDKYGITAEELADPDFDLTKAKNKHTNIDEISAVIDKVGDWFSSKYDTNEPDYWTKKHEELADVCIDEDTFAVFVDYAINLGASYNGLVNHALGVENNFEKV